MLPLSGQFNVQHSRLRHRSTMVCRRMRTRFIDEGLPVFMVTLFLFLSAIILHIANDVPDEDTDLCKEIPASQEYNRRVVQNYSYKAGVDPDFMLMLGVDERAIDAIQDVKPNEPVIVTAIKAERFSNVLVWIDHLKEQGLTTKYKIIVYDLGLAADERSLICRQGECYLRSFPNDQYPAHVGDKLTLNAWKPILIQLCLKEFGFVVWMDSTVFLIDGDIKPGIETALKEGIAISYRAGIDKDIPLAFSTSELTFESLSESPCAFQKLYQFNAGFLFIRRTQFTEKFIMRPWLGCALSDNCISGGRLQKFSCFKANRVGFCHRFDISALSIILHRLYPTNKQRDQIDITPNVRWVNCFSDLRTELIFFPDDILVPDGSRYDIADCPLHLLEKLRQKFLITQEARKQNTRLRLADVMV